MVHTFKTIAVIGAGTMGNGIAHVFAQNGFNVNLVDVFTAMKASTETIPDGKADVKEIQAYFTKVYPDMDFERVYASDMKKMVKWYNVLKANDVEIKLSHAAEEEGEEQAAEVTEPDTQVAEVEKTEE